jgi:hypothetical protein
MDHYCLYDTPGQTLLDTGDVTLQFPDRHTIHCLVDVGVCRAGPFYILGDPMIQNNGDLYTVEYVLDDAGRLTLIDLARAEGKCSTCMGDGALVRGYRAEVIGVVTALATAEIPAIQLTLTSARTSNGLSDVCAGLAKPGTCSGPMLSTVCARQCMNVTVPRVCGDSFSIPAATSAPSSCTVLSSVALLFPQHRLL